MTGTSADHGNLLVQDAAAGDQSMVGYGGVERRRVIFENYRSYPPSLIKLS
jgi:hypothetical protein